MKKIIQISLIIALFLLFIPSLLVKGLDEEAYLITTNPAQDTSSEMNVAWHSTISGTFVEYTKSDDTMFTSSTKVDGECVALTYYDEGTKTDISDYKCGATLSNLESETSYIYRVGKTIFSQTYSFMTSGTSAFTFMYISDVHVYPTIPSRYTAAQNLINTIESKYRNLKFIVTGGDMTAYGTVRDEWTSYYSLTAFQKYMIAGTPGNHEYYDRSAGLYADSKKYFNMYTNNPDNGATGVENGCYYFIYGNTLFISLDSEAYRLSSQPEEFELNQKSWLIDVLENNPCQYTVLFHHMYYYAGNEVSSSMKGLQPIIDKYGVDLVLTGHDHVYTRSNRIYNSTNCSDSKKGAIYITSSAVGDRLESESSLSTDVYVAKKISNTSVALGITVSGENMMVKTYDEAGNILDQVAIPAKMANFDIEESMKKVEVLVDEDDFSKSKLEFTDEFFAKAYKIDVLENDEIIATTRPKDNQTTLDIPNIDVNDYKKNYTVNVYFRDGQVATKEIEIINPNATFGKIENVRIEGSKLVWDSNIDNEMLQKIAIYANDVLLGEVSPTVKEFSLEDVNNKQINTIALKGFGINDTVLFETTTTYGEEIVPVDVHFVSENVELEVGQRVDIELAVIPEIALELVYSSSDETIVKIENGVLVALKEGEATITVTANDRDDVKDTMKVKVMKVEITDPGTDDPVIDEPVKDTGCNSGTIFWYLIIPLGLFIIRRKKF